MNSKEYLKKAYKIQLDIDTLRETIKELRSSLDGLQAVSFSEKIQGGKLKDDSNLVNKIFKITELEDKIKRKVELQFEIIDSIEKLNDVNEKAVLRLKYICSLTWEQIAEKMGYSIRNVHLIHKKALKNFKKMH